MPTEYFSHSQFIDGSDPTQLSGSGAFTGIQGNFFDACGASSSCQGRAYLVRIAGRLQHMESMLNKQSRFQRCSMGCLSHIHLLPTNGRAATVDTPMSSRPRLHVGHAFEGSSPGAGVTGLALHMMGTIKDMVDGTASVSVPRWCRNNELERGYSRCNYAMLRVLLRANLVHDSSGKTESIAAVPAMTASDGGLCGIPFLRLDATIRPASSACYDLTLERS